jgi:polyphosphate glucokinase
MGKRKWNRVLVRAIDQLRHTFNFRVLYLGGGNARRVALPVPRDVRVVDNVAGLLGGVRLWERP